MTPEERRAKAREAARKYRLSHPEKQKAYDRRPEVAAKRRALTKAWIARNREAYLLQRRAQYREKAAEISAVNKLKRAADPERFQAAQRRYKERHPGRAKELRERDLEKSRRKGRETMRRWYARNAEKSKARSTAYTKKHYARILAARRARYAADPSYRVRQNAYAAGRRMFGRGGSLTAAEWREIWESYRGLCAYCPEPARTMDHVIPRASGGRHEAGNVVPACKRCNSSKRTRPLLRFLLKRGILAAWPSRESGASRFSSASRVRGPWFAR